LTFSLFGKAFRNINKPLLVNSINEKNCVVEVEFTTNGKDYKIVRGVKPNIFEIWCASVLVNQDSSSKDYQDYLEKFILNMNYKSFTQIVILGSASFVPFMQLSPVDRRVVIEDLLDIQIFSVMNGIVKQKLQVNKEEIEKNRLTLSAIESRKEYIEKTIDSLKINNQNRITEIEDRISKYELEIENIQKEIVDLEKQRDAFANIDLKILKNKHLQLIKLKTGITSNYQKTKNTIQFFEDHDNCPTCYQLINVDVKQVETGKLDQKVIEFADGLLKINLHVDSVLDDISNAEKKLEQFNALTNEINIKKSHIGNHTSIIKDLLKQKEKLSNSDTLMEENVDALKGVLVRLQESQDEKVKLLDEKKYIEVATNLLKDGGIKTNIIKQYLPVINKSINKYLQQMGFFVNFNIDENFEETIKSRHRDTFSYENFSEGEKMRIDLAILFTWKTIAKMKNSVNCNILFFDEIFDSSLDTNGTDEFLKIILNLTADTNTFIISHKQDQLIDKFQRVYRFQKVRNFSVLGN
jgi:DNA repair exonuclease SbcCD ATPase subunit